MSEKLVVSLEIAKKLARRGWKRGQTSIMYAKENNSSVYQLQGQNRWIIGYDAPTATDIRIMSEKLGLSLELNIHVDSLAMLLILHLKKNKLLKLSYFELQEQGNDTN